MFDFIKKVHELPESTRIIIAVVVFLIVGALFLYLTFGNFGETINRRAGIKIETPQIETVDTEPTPAGWIIESASMLKSSILNFTRTIRARLMNLGFVESIAGAADKAAGLEARLLSGFNAFLVKIFGK